MAPSYAVFGSYILFKETLVDVFGHLYRAGEFNSSGVVRTVWLRVFDGPGVHTLDIIDGFSSGRKIAKLLQTANVASGATFLEENGVAAMAYDYSAGHSLAALFQKVRDEGFPVPVDNALLIMEKLANGLSSGLVVDVGGSSLSHGLLHPGLAMVSNDGEGVVAGFGIADQLLGLLDEQQPAEQIKPYLAPEVILTRAADKMGDVYSLGAILFELLTGDKLPPDPDSRLSAIDTATVSDDDEPIPDDIKVLLTRALAPRSEDRFSSSADFKKELDKLLYGGNYSPTTFNLALFMDRLFRADIESTENERAAEADVDVQPYLAPKPEPEPVETIAEPAPRNSKGVIYALAATLAVLAVVVGFLVIRGSDTRPPPPSAEELARQRTAQEERVRQMAARMVEETMKAKEAEIMAELEERQTHIETLQKKLEESQKQSSSRADRAQQEALQKQIAAEREQQRARQAALEEEKQRLLEEAKIEAEEKAKEQARQAAEAQVAENLEPTPAPTEVAVAAEQIAASQVPVAVTVEENQFLDPTIVDVRPAILKEVPVTWSRMAMRSRRKGTVILQATVNADGAVEDVKILRADETGFGIPESVMDAVRKYRFKPGMKDGVKVKTYATVTQRYVFTR